MDVITLLVPLVNLSGTRGDFVPFRVLPGEISIEAAENFRRERGPHCVANFLQTRPQIAEENLVAVGASPHRILGQIEIDTASQGTRDDERGRHQEIRFDVLVNARLEIAVAGKHRGGDEIELADRLLDFWMKRA